MSGQTKSILDIYKIKAAAAQSEMSATAGDVAGKRETAVSAAATCREKAAAAGADKDTAQLHALRQGAYAITMNGTSRKAIHQGTFGRCLATITEETNG